MKKLSIASFFLLFTVLFAFSELENQEEIDYLLFFPNESSRFVGETQAMIQLDNLAEYLLGKDLTPGQIYIYGYAAFAENDIDPLSLSRDRALFVIGELQKRGVSRNLFSDPVAHGSVNLWGGNTNEEDRIPNRRVRVILDGNFVTPETVKESAPEIVISSADVKEPVGQETTTEKSGAKLPLWPFILLHFFVLTAVILFILSRRKKSRAAKPAGLLKAESVKAEPIIAEHVNTEPVKINPVKAESVKAEPVKAETVKTEPIKAEPAKAVPARAVPSVPVIIIRKKVVDLDEEIRLRAHELYLERGGRSEDAAEDWYRALNDVCAKYESAGCRVYFDGEYWRATLRETNPS